MKIGIVGPVHQKGLDIFRDHQFNFVEITDTNPSNLIEKLKDVDGVVLRTAPLDNNVLEECSKIKIVSRHGVGYDNVDINYLNKSNIALAITGTANAVSVAEHVMAFFLHLTKIINISDMTPLSRTSVCSEKPALYALEVNQGVFKKNNINAGDILAINKTLLNDK